MTTIANLRRYLRRSGQATLIAAVALLFAAGASAQEMKLVLNGAAEVPPAKTSATGTGTITVAADRTISGSVTTTGMKGTMAHIHEAAADANGPVAIPLVQDGDGKWSVPAGTKLNDAQYAALKAGKLYVNVHSARYPGGEVRAQLMP
ncbi:MAG: CHRD domain-containing protein [Burkholderiales bacterium]|nr:MAG: CHRD domain-containing protein [Burkholderiales bacterium]